MFPREMIEGVQVSWAQHKLEDATGKEHSERNHLLETENVVTEM